MANLWRRRIGWTLQWRRFTWATSFCKRIATPLVNYTLAAFGMFGIRGGDEWLYNLPGRSIFDPLTALVFLFGIIVAVRHRRSPQETGATAARRSC